MHSFEVHSNESACRKKVRLGLEQVHSRSGKHRKIYKENYRKGTSGKLTSMKDVSLSKVRTPMSTRNYEIL